MSVIKRLSDLGSKGLRNIADDAVMPSTVTIGNISSTELGYLDGVTSAVQTQLNAKANLSGATFSNTVTVNGNIIAGSGGDIGATAAISGGTVYWYNDYGSWATANKVGINISNPGFNFEVSGRIKLRSGTDTAGMWLTNANGDQTIFTGLINDSQWGVYTSNKWQLSATSSSVNITDNLIFDYLGIQLDRSWDNYPGIQVRNDQRLGPPWEFRIHGYPGVSGGDFGVYVRSDGGGNASDGRIKTNVTTISDALNKVLNLRGVRYQRWNKDLEVETHMSEADGFRFGVIAQEVLPIIPEVVKSSDNPTILENGWSDQYAVDYGSLTPLLIEAIKELNSRIEALENK